MRHAHPYDERVEIATKRRGYQPKHAKRCFASLGLILARSKGSTFICEKFLGHDEGSTPSAHRQGMTSWTTGSAR